MGRLGVVVVPAEYAAEHLDLGYAVTSYRAQGITVDSSHVLADASMTRETFYVAMTRGREQNIAYVAVDKPDPAHDGPRPGDNTEATARSVLFGVLQHVGGALSARRSLRSRTPGPRSRSLPPSTRPWPPPPNTTAGPRSSARLGSATTTPRTRSPHPHSER